MDASLRVGDFCSRERPKRDRRRSEQGGGRLWESRSFWRSLRLFRPFTVVIAASRCGLARRQVAFCGSKGGRLWDGRWPSMGKKVAGYGRRRWPSVGCTGIGGRLWDEVLAWFRAAGRCAAGGSAAGGIGQGKGGRLWDALRGADDRGLVLPSAARRWPFVGCTGQRWPSMGWASAGSAAGSGGTRAGGGRLWDSQTIIPVFRK